MMYPPVFETCIADSGVQQIFGATPCRVFMFGHSAGNSGGAPVKPYAVWQTVGGSPENYLGEIPDIDSWTLQFDVYATTAALARSGAEALRDAIEHFAHITSWRGESKDTETKLYRYSFDVDWISGRETTS